MTTLRAAIMEANALPDGDVITVPAGTYTLTIAGSAEDLGKKGDLDISSSVTITGAGATKTFINAATLDRVLDVLAGAVLNLSGVTVKGGVVYSVGGGGVYNRSNGTATISNSVISGNWASYYGGGVYNKGTLTVTSTTFSDNSADWGGGIDNSEGAATITGSTFSWNTGYTGGGGIANSAAAQIASSTFSNNSAARGGAVYNSLATATIANSTLTGNSAVRSGGGIYNWGPMEIVNSTLSGNSAKWSRDLSEGGGGVYNDEVYGVLTITNSALSGNSANNGRGGGIYNRAMLAISGSSLSANATRYYGGGIHNSSGGTAEITDSVLSGNSAGYGGGGVSNHGGVVTITESTLSSNVGTNFGGAIHNSGSTTTTTVNNSLLSGNSATYDGGGVYNQTYAVLTISNSTLSGNSANNGRGGALCNAGYGSSMTITNSTVSGNSAKFAGGGIRNEYTAGTVRLKNTIIAGNTTPISLPDVDGTFNSQGYNLIGNSRYSSGWIGSDVLDVDPLLGPLQDNGGTTLTRALLPGSPAIDAGDNSVVPDITGPYDQRGPGFLRIVNGRVDIGAFERELPPNGPPVGEAGGGDTGYVGFEGSPTEFDASGSSDPDRDPLLYRWDFDSDGTWDTSYSEDPTATHTWGDDYSGTVTVEVYDGQETATDTAFVAVKNVAPAVAITGVPESNPEGMPISLGSGVTEPGSADTHTYAWSVTKNGDDYRSGGNADFNFTPNDNGSYVVSIVVTDDDGGEGTASVTIEVANVPPTASVDEASVDEDGPPLDIAVLGNDSDPAGIRDPLTIIGVDTQVTVGSVAWTAAGVTYNPDGKFEPLGVGETATDTFAYTIDDGDGGTDTATVTVTIEGQNDAPTVVNPIADVTAMEDGPDTSTDVSGVFADVDADDTLVLSVYSSNSTLLIAAVVGNVLTLDYLPDRSGSTTITVRATDAAGAFVENAFTVTVLSASQQIQQILMPQVQALVESGVLNGGQGNSLISKLAGAQGQLDQGNVNAGVNKLGAFINEVKALVKSRRLTSQQGQNLIEAAEAAINSAQPAADAAGAALAALGKSDRSSNSWLHPLDSSLLDELVAASSQKSGKGTSNK